jgi:NADH:ubiquinone oxidoreductase subunit 5 (subunit L)/multisubunit Na+/H+ antiporter MnhA subunit
MSQLLQLFILVPLFYFIVSLLFPRKREKLIAQTAITAISVHLAGIAVFIAYWLINGHPVLDIKHLTLFKAGDIEIFIDFYFDKVTAVYALMGAAITLLVIVFSRYYLHRDDGFKRFFSTVLLFFFAYNMVIFSGNFETLFLGWEILGVCSFLLIAFYRDRYLPVKNGLKVISVYRLGDICLILTMWMSHQLWHENITFFKLNDAALVQGHLQQHNWYGIFICIMLVMAAATKSAQLPFSSWLPRAMEGPTTSSAIFYGSLSVHLGVFLLLRTYPYWESVTMIKVLVIGIGLLTSVVASGIARVQSAVKTQIAYSSIAQIGLIFIEVALGFHVLALIHFAGNAFLRTYQLLVSPSVLSYLIHDMVFNYKPQQQKATNSFVSKIKNTLYVLSVKEWNLDTFMYRFLWSPFKWIGNQLNFLTGKIAGVILFLLLIVGLYSDLYPESVPAGLGGYLPVIFSFVALLLILKAFTERQNAKRAWVFIFVAQLFLGLAIALVHEDFGLDYLLIYLGGIIFSSALGYVCLSKIEKIENGIDLNRFHGHTHEHPVLAFLFLLSCLGLIGFPYTPTFIGIDLLFSHIHKQEIALIIFVSLTFIFMEFAILRIYARVFLGQHTKNYHPIAYRSS